MTVSEEPSFPRSPPLPSDPLLSYHTFVLIQTFINCALNPVLLIFGVTTNILNAIVFYRQSLRDRMNFCLFCVAIVDALNLCTVFILGSHCMVSRFDQNAGALVATYARNYVSVINEEMMHCSAVITTIISVERCICVALPMKAATILKTRTMALLVVSSLLTIHVLSCVTFLKRIVHVGFDNRTEQLVTRIYVSELYVKYPEVFDRYYVFVSIVLKVVTFVMVTVATAMTVFILKRAIAWREATSSSGEEHHTTRSQLSLVKMLVVLSCIYILCALPSVVVMTVRSLVAEFEPWGPYPLTVICTFMMAQVSTSANSAVNFIVFMARSSRFGRVLCEVIPCVGRLYPNRWRQDARGAASSSAMNSALKNDCAAI